MLLFFLGFSIDSLSDIFFFGTFCVWRKPAPSSCRITSVLHSVCYFFLRVLYWFCCWRFFFFFFLEHSVSDVNCKNSSIDYRRVFADRINGAPSKGYILFLFVMFSLQRMMHSQVRGLGPNARNAALSSLMDWVGHLLYYRLQIARTFSRPIKIHSRQFR